MAIMRDAGIVVCESPSTLGQAMKELLAGAKPRAKEEAKPAPKAAAKSAPKATPKPAPKGPSGKKPSKR
jgi:hypothetical protein